MFGLSNDYVILARSAYTNNKFAYVLDEDLNAACRIWVASCAGAISLQEFLDGTGIR